MHRLFSSVPETRLKVPGFHSSVWVILNPSLILDTWYKKQCPKKVGVLEEKSINTHFLPSAQALNWHARNAKLQIHDDYEPHDNWGTHTHVHARTLWVKWTIGSMIWGARRHRASLQAVTVTVGARLWRKSTHGLMVSDDLNKENKQQAAKSARSNKEVGISLYWIRTFIPEGPYQRDTVPVWKRLLLVQQGAFWPADARYRTQYLGISPIFSIQRRMGHVATPCCSQHHLVWVLHHTRLVEKLQNYMLTLNFMRRTQWMYFLCVRPFNYLLQSLFLGAIVRPLLSGWSVVKKVGCRYCKSVTLRTPDGAKVSPPITQRRTSHMYDQTATPPRLSANGEVT